MAAEASTHRLDETEENPEEPDAANPRKKRRLDTHEGSGLEQSVKAETVAASDPLPPPEPSTAEPTPQADPPAAPSAPASDPTPQPTEPAQATPAAAKAAPPPPAPSNEAADASKPPTPAVDTATVTDSATAADATFTSMLSDPFLAAGHNTTQAKHTDGDQPMTDAQPSADADTAAAAAAEEPAVTADTSAAADTTTTPASDIPATATAADTPAQAGNEGATAAAAAAATPAAAAEQPATSAPPSDDSSASWQAQMASLQQPQQDQLWSQLGLLFLQQHLQQQQEQQQQLQHLQQQLQQPPASIAPPTSAAARPPASSSAPAITEAEQPAASGATAAATGTATSEAQPLLDLQQLLHLATLTQHLPQPAPSQVSELTRIPPPPQLELSMPQASPSNAPAAALQGLSPQLSPAQLAHVLLALQTVQQQNAQEGSSNGTNTDADMTRLVNGQGPSALSLGGSASSEGQQGEGEGDSVVHRPKARPPQLMLPQLSAADMTLLHLFPGLADAATVQSLVAQAQTPPGVSALLSLGGQENLDENMQMAVAALYSLGQQAAGATPAAVAAAAAAAVAADAEAAAAAQQAPTVSAAAAAVASMAAGMALPPVSPLTLISQPGAIPKRARSKKQTVKTPRAGGAGPSNPLGQAPQEDAHATAAATAAGDGSATAAPHMAAGTSDADANAAAGAAAEDAANANAAATAAAAAAPQADAPQVAEGDGTALADNPAEPSSSSPAAPALALLNQTTQSQLSDLPLEQREAVERIMLQLLPLLGSQFQLNPSLLSNPDDPNAPPASNPLTFPAPVHPIVEGATNLPNQPQGLHPTGPAGTTPANFVPILRTPATTTAIARNGRKDTGPKRLLDFRLHVPHKFVETHFPEQTFPLHTTADVFVNDETVLTGAPVKLYSTRNNTRKTGIGNFWLTGLQQTIKLYKDVKVNEIAVTDASEEGGVKTFVLRLSAQGIWHEPPAFVKRGLGQTGDTTGNPAVKPYDGRIHVPLQLMKTYFADRTEYPLMAEADMYMNDQPLGQAVAVRVVRYQKHKREGHYNYWITGHQKLVRSCNDLRVLSVDYLPVEGRFKICFVAPEA